MTQKLSSVSINHLEQFSQTSVSSQNSSKEIRFEKLHQKLEMGSKLHHFSHITIGQADKSKSDSEHCCLIRIILAIYRCICCILCCSSEETKGSSKIGSRKREEKPLDEKGTEEQPFEKPKQEEKKRVDSPKGSEHPRNEEKKLDSANRPSVGQPINVPKPITFKELITQREEVNFKNAIKDATAEEILGYCERDAFGIGGYASTFELEFIFKCLTAVQSKAFIQGYLEKHFEQLFAFVTVENRVQLLNDFLEVIHTSRNPGIFWKKLYDFRDSDQKFVRYAIQRVLKTDKLIPTLNQIHEDNPNLLRNALKERFNSMLTYEEWKKINAWAASKGVPLEPMPKEVVEYFDVVKRGGREAIAKFLQKVCLEENRNKENFLVPILADFSLDDITYYVREDVNAFNLSNVKIRHGSYGSYHSENYDSVVAIINCLNGPKLHHFIKLIAEHPLFGIKFQEHIKRDYRLHAGIKDGANVLKLLNDCLRIPKEAKFLADFNKLRGSLDVKTVLASALGSSIEECAFGAIANEITTQEITNYVSPTNDCFKLSDLQFSLAERYDPLTGLFLTLPIEKLKHFIARVFKRDEQRLFERILKLIPSCEDAKKREIYAYVIEECIQKDAKYWGFIQNLSYIGYIEFAHSYFALALQCDSVQRIERLEMLYRKNRKLFEQSMTSLPANLSGAKEWYNLKKAKDPKPVPFQKATKESLLATFNGCRNDPDQVRVFLDLDKSEENFNEENLKLVFKAMTKEEVAIYAREENNCFGIKNAIYRQDDYLGKLFKAFDHDPEKLQALISSTTLRRDLRNAQVEISLLRCANQSPAREKLLLTLIEALTQSGKIDKFIKQDLQGWNDGKVENGPHYPAMRAFMLCYYKQGLEMGEEEFNRRMNLMIIYTGFIDKAVVQTLDQSQQEILRKKMPHLFK